MEFPDAELFCDNPDDPQYLFGPFYWFCTFDALTDEAADEFVSELPSRQIAFGGIRRRWAEKIVAKREPLWHSKCHLIYWPEKSCIVPDTYPIRRLTPDDVELVNEHWYLGQGKAQDYIRERIENGFHAACDDEQGLVSWAMTHTDGSMGFLYTMERARHKGYAQVVGMALIKMILDAGETPFGYIVEGNDASINFSTNMGLKLSGLADYLELPEV